VRLTTARDCWVALPAALLSRLLDSGAPMPLVLELRPAGPAGVSLIVTLAAHQTGCSMLAGRVQLGGEDRVLSKHDIECWCRRPEGLCLGRSLLGISLVYMEP